MADTAKTLSEQILADIMVAAEEGYAVALDARDAVLAGWTETMRAALDQAREDGRLAGVRLAAAIARGRVTYLRRHLDDPHQADGAATVLRRLEELMEVMDG